MPYNYCHPFDMHTAGSPAPLCQVCEVSSTLVDKAPSGGAEAPSGGAEAPSGGAEAPSGGAEALSGGAEAPSGGAEPVAVEVSFTPEGM